MVGGKLQKPGRNAAAKIVKADFSETKDEFVIDYTAAYATTSLKSLVRTMSFDRENATITITDSVSFSEPSAFEVDDWIYVPGIGSALRENRLDNIPAYVIKDGKAAEITQISAVAAPRGSLRVNCLTDAKNGLDFIGKIKSPIKSFESIGFPEFTVPQKNDRFDCDEQSRPTSDDERAAHFEAMRTALEKMNLPVEKKEGLLERIQHKIILSPVQLRPDSVKYERIEAGGMDFSGKLHIVEGSISSNSMVELQFDDRVIVGVPLSVTKTGTDASVLMEVMPEKTEKLLSIGQAKFVKRIRGSVLR